MKQEFINLVDAFKTFLLNQKQEEVQVETKLAEEKKEEPDQYVLEDGETQVKIYSDGTIEGVQVDPGQVLITADGSKIIIGQDGKVAKVEKIEIPEEEKPLETELETEEPKEEEQKADEQEADKDALIESLMDQIDALVKENEELKKAIEDGKAEKEEMSKQHLSAVDELNKKVSELEAQIPTVVAGVEVKQTAQESQTKMTRNELLKANFGC